MQLGQVIVTMDSDVWSAFLLGRELSARILRRRPSTRRNVTMFHHSTQHILSAVAILVFSLAAAAQSPATGRTRHVVIATVNDAEILQAELDAWLAELPAEQRQAAETAMLRALIDRQLVLDYLQARSLGASPQELDLEVQRWSKTLAGRGLTLDEYFEQSGMDEAALRRLFAWKIGWFRFTDKHVTPSRLQKYFHEHNRDFDGTRLHVAHILWTADPEDMATDLEEANRVRQAILDGETSFDEAARKRSQGPSAVEGGDLGWIERRHPMHPAFSAAAFQLDVGQVSPPVITPFGIHLIRCLEIQPGELQLSDVRPQVVSSATRSLFHNLAARQRKQSRIDIFTDARRR